MDWPVLVTPLASPQTDTFKKGSGLRCKRVAQCLRLFHRRTHQHILWGNRILNSRYSSGFTANLYTSITEKDAEVQ